MNLKSCIDDAGGVYTVAAWIGKTPRAMYKCGLRRTRYHVPSTPDKQIIQKLSRRRQRGRFLKKYF